MNTDTYLLLEPDSGERLRFLGESTMRLKADGSDTAGTMAFYEYVSEPGTAGAPQHIHHGHDESFYVVEGEYRFVLDAKTISARSGSFLYVPRGTPHGFYNAGPSTGRIVGTFTPARFADYFRELAQIIDETGRPPDHDAWVELYGRYDTTFYVPTNVTV